MRNAAVAAAACISAAAIAGISPAITSYIAVGQWVEYASLAAITVAVTIARSWALRKGDAVFGAIPGDNFSGLSTTAAAGLPTATK